MIHSLKENLLNIIFKTMNFDNTTSYNEAEIKEILDVCTKLGISNGELKDIIGKGTNSTVFKAGDYVIKIRKRKKKYKYYKKSSNHSYIFKN